jgi:ATP-dependent helicase/nuclease subunit A
VTGPTAETIRRQALASDPAASAWVSANAGSGKTYVLVQRVVRLLLAGADPTRILCLTFTKAAAANMQNRVVERLRGWATAPDSALAKEIAELEGAAPDAARLAAARRLFARAIETPGGLKIYTIHAFCGRLLHQFPFEANVPAGFTELDERDQVELMAQARAAVLAKAGRDPASPIGRALSYVVARVAEQTLDSVVAEATDERDALRRLLTAPGIDGPDGAAAGLRTLFGLGTDEREATLKAAVLDDGVPASEWPSLAATLRTGSVNDQKLGDHFAAAASAASEEDRRQAYLCVFFTGGGTPRAARGFVTTGTRAAHPTIAAALDRELTRLAALIPRIKAAATVERTHALLILAEAAIAAYSAAKAAQGLLDYDDLIAKARNLLLRADAAWVLYKLDGGLDHILVDEAQDTAPAQWEIVRKLTEDFLAGAGARASATRTVFAVGDEKQSIFGFQGAEPAAFGATRRAYEAAHSAIGKPFAPVRLVESFRSTRAVLAGVDAVFSRPEAHRGLAGDDEPGTFHSTTRLDAAGSVELWPIVSAAPSARAEEAWDAPFDQVNPESAVVRLAEAVAAEIARANAEDGTPRGEILVLVRQRKALFEAILRALKRRGVPVAGADRLIVGEHIAVMDLLALGDAIVTQDDDLALACALKSPLFGLDDDDLMAVAPRRSGRLLDALASGPPRAAAAHERFRRFATEARARTAFSFYASVLSGGARRAFRARLGHEVDDPLDAFLDLALDFSRTHPPTLAGFLRWMRAAPAEIKRDLDVSSGEVRVMTVHGAKGLEAGLVVLADTCGPSSGRGSALIMVPRPDAGHDAPPVPVWAGRKDDDPPALAAARAEVQARAEAEHRRLLYVAMTRAKDRLIVCGHDIGKTRPDGAWYDLVRDGLSGAADVEQVDIGGEAPLLRLRSGVPTAAAVAADIAAAPLEPAPAWLSTPAAPEAAPGPPLSPSALVAEDDEAPVFTAGPGAEAARARGILLHRLLKSLPDIVPERREEAAGRIVATASSLFDAAAQAEIASAALAIVADPAFAGLFAPGGRGEVPIVGRLRDGRAVSGRIDRLAVTPEAVLVVDYKTDRRPPPPGAPAPAGYAAQLAAYAELLAEIWPDRPVRCAILWTAAPRLELLPS